MAWLAALSLLALGDASFVPFAGIEELKPHRIHEHCGPNADEEGFRWCARSFRKRLEDGGDVELSWAMHVNPDSILSLDTEAEHGVRITKCSPGEVELDIPHSHLSHMEVGKFIVGSHYVHGCSHLKDESLYHRVAQVRSKSLSLGAGRMYRYKLITQNLPHMGHMARHVSFNFSYMPIEAREDDQKFPEKRTYSDLPPHDRRLFDFPKIPGFAAPTSGNFAGQGQASGSVKTQNGIVNFSPEQVSNFGWNWDFYLNDTKAPSFEIDRPDTKGTFVLKHPYIKAHAGCFLNFTSQYTGFMKPPHVKWQAGLKGHGIVQGRLEAAMNSTRSADLDAAKYKLPARVMEVLPFLRLLTKFDKVRWFSPIEHSVGPMPSKLTPGFEFQVEFYHKGPFSGFLAFGGSTHGTMEPVLHYDSEKGFDQTLRGLLLDTDVWPPMYMVFTKAFEMGVKVQPKFHMKGDFMGFDNAEAAFHMSIYQNVTVYRKGNAQFDVDKHKALIIFPFRVVGPKTLSFKVRHKLKISCLGKTVESAPAVTWGDIEFHDQVARFNFGNVTDAGVLNAHVVVTLIQVQMGDNSESELGSCSFTMPTLQDGTAPPYWCNLQNTAGTSVANAQLYIVHKENPEIFLASRIKGVGIKFPIVTMQPATICSLFPQLPDNCPLALQITLGKRRDTIKIDRTFSCSQMTVPTDAAGKTSIELMPSFVDTWAPCLASAQYCTCPSIELLCGSVSLGKAKLPAFGLQEDPHPNLLGALIGAKTQTAAPTAEQNLHPPAVTLDPASATIQMEVKETPPSASNMFLQPPMASEVALGSQVMFVWTIDSAVLNQEQAFQLVPLKLVDESSPLLANLDLTTLRKVNDKYLVPIGTAQESAAAKCEQRSIGNMAAEQLPCSFAENLGFNTPTFLVGELVVLLVKWTVGGIEHKMFSPAVEIVAARRRLQAGSGPPAAPQPLKAADPSSILSHEQNPTNPNIDDAMTSKDCQREDLRFNFGQGAEFRCEILSMGVPQDFPELYNDPDDNEPIYASPWAAMEGTQPAMEAKDFLPDGACDMGFCDSMLPGCRQAKFKKLHFPKLVFNFSKPFKFGIESNNTQTHKMMKEAMAWAFSAMPEAVTVMLQELEAQEKEKKKQTAVPNYGFGNYGNAGNAQGSQNPGQMNWFSAPSQTSAIANTQQMPKAFGKWWNTQRRLRESQRKGINHAGEVVDMPTKLMPHQVQVEFRDGLPYIVDHNLVNRMIRGRLFQFITKKEQPEITGFYLEDMGTATLPPDSDGSDFDLTGGQLASGGVAVCAAAALALAVALAVNIRRKSSSGYLKQNDGEGLE